MTTEKTPGSQGLTEVRERMRLVDAPANRLALGTSRVCRALELAARRPDEPQNEITRYAMDHAADETADLWRALAEAFPNQAAIRHTSERQRDKATKIALLHRGRLMTIKDAIDDLAASASRAVSMWGRALSEMILPPVYPDEDE